MELARYIKEFKSKMPVIVLDMKEYEALVEYLEDLEDRLAILERKDEPNISQDEVEKKFKKKFDSK